MLPPAPAATPTLQPEETTRGTPGSASVSPTPAPASNSEGEVIVLGTGQRSPLSIGVKSPQKFRLLLYNSYCCSGPRTATKTSFRIAGVPPRRSLFFLRCRVVGGFPVLCWCCWCCCYGRVDDVFCLSGLEPGRFRGNGNAKTCLSRNAVAGHDVRDLNMPQQKGRFPPCFMSHAAPQTSVR